MTPPPLREAIDQFRANDISTMLERTGVTEIPKTKDAKVDLWAKLMGDPDRIRIALDKLSPSARAALDILQRRGPDAEVRTKRFVAQIEHEGLLKNDETLDKRKPLFGLRPGVVTKNPTTAENVLATLLTYGLVWSHTTRWSNNSKLDLAGGVYVYIPHEVYPHLPPARAPKVAPPPTIVQTLPASARTFQRDIYLYWSAAREQPLQLTNAGLLRLSDLKRISGQLLVSETLGKGAKEAGFRRLFFLRRLLTALKLLTQESGGSVLRATNAPAFLQGEPTERVRQCFEMWRDGAWWNELYATYVQGSTRAPATAEDFAPPVVVHARRKVLDALIQFAAQSAKTNAGEADGAWIGVRQISDYLRDVDEEFLIERQTAEQQTYYASYWSTRPTSPYEVNTLGWQWSGYETDENAGWEGVEGVFIRAVLSEAPYWMGLLDLGYTQEIKQDGGSAPENVAAVRLTDMGRWLLLGAERPTIPAETGRVVVQPNFHIFAFDPIADSTLAQLDRFATRLNAERAIEYEISRESVYQAQQLGMTAGDIAAWLEEVTGAALPQNVMRNLEEWQAAYERITIRPHVALLHVADAHLLDQVMADPNLTGAVIKRLDPTAALVRADKTAWLERQLLEAGELPAHTARGGAAPRGSISIDAGGHIHFRQQLPNLAVCALLQPIATENGGNWRITAESVRAAANRGIEANFILNTLNQLTAGAVPEPLTRQIKAWAGYYGSATQQTLIVLQFRDQTTLDALRADPDLARHLQPFHPKAQLGLATVAPTHLARVREVLAGYGVDVTEK
jgi:hypothetical protein